MHLSRSAAAVVAALFLFSGAAFAQGGVLQSGGVVPGHGTCWAANGIVNDCGAQAGPFVLKQNGSASNLAITNPALTGGTSTGLALTTPAISGGTIAGTTITGGTIVTTMGQFDSLLVNPNPNGEAPVYTSGNTANLTIGNSSHSITELWAILDGGTSHDGTASVTRSVAGSTVTQLNALSGYCDNANPDNISTNIGVCVAVGGFVVNRVDGGMSWWIDAIMSDAGAGGGSGRLMQGEVDFKPLYVNTAVNGLVLTMDSPVSLTTADGFICGSTSNVHRWNNCFRTYPAQTTIAFWAGLSQPAGTHSANSTPIVMEGTDSGGASHLARLIVEGAATSLIVDRDDSGTMNLNVVNGNVDLATGKGYNVNGSLIISDRQQGWTAGTNTIGSPNKGAINYGTATLLQLANRVQALEQAIFIGVGPHGLIGP